MNKKNQRRDSKSTQAINSSAADSQAAIHSPVTQPLVLPASVLDTAKSIVYGARQEDYGTPTDNHGTTAALWSTYLGTIITPRQVCIMNMLQKISRDMCKDGHDHLVDIAGYAENAYMIAKQEAIDKHYVEQAEKIGQGAKKRFAALKKALGGVLPETAHWVTADMCSKRRWKVDKQTNIDGTHPSVAKKRRRGKRS